MQNKYDTSDELRHYGVVGMKWGMRRAAKKGTTYSYKSHGQKKYEKRLAKQTSKNAKEQKIAKTKAKLGQYKQRDKNRVDYAKSTSIGKSVAKQILMGPIGSGTYSRMRAAGSGRGEAFLMSNWIAGTLGAPYGVLYSKSKENGTARQEKKLLNQAREESRS